MLAETKTCTECLGDKPVSEFYVNRKMVGGHLNQCKVCVCARVRHQRRGNERVQEYDRLRAKTPDRKAHAARVSKKWREDNPEAYRAQTAVANALRVGTLSKEPCLFCESKVNLHAHHRDYSKYLEVVWVCARCHHRLHANFPELEGTGKGL